ncbi:MAG: aminomethyl-transferring glycine dehydrogenase subunit GcvPA [Bacillota bacterium]|nr:aminomethyl-transferring glycine dehydrogenase subunit GcvPA [Bacillota bacterium]
MARISYVPNTDKDRQEMLAKIGFKSMDELFAHIPANVKLNRPLDIPDGMSELEVVRLLTELSSKNKTVEEYNSFLGAGTYEHFIPSLVNHMLLRSEFYTAYTPYQPEISQGTLQAIYEFQSLICELTGMEVANASMYDGATALAEAAALASGQTRRDKIVVASTIHPEYLETLKTYGYAQGLEIVEVNYADGVVDLTELEAAVCDKTAAVLIQQPNFFGCIEEAKAIGEIAHKHKAIFVVAADLISLAILKAPAEYGADIVVGDAQVFGNPPSFGGPHVGYFACVEKLIRRIPGRVVGKTVDKNGKEGFVLTLQAREQHIRREKATSNICSNQALAALAANITMVSLGKEGIKEMARQCVAKATYTLDKLEQIGLTRKFSKPFFKEFVVTGDKNIKEINKGLLSQKIIGGLDLSRFYPQLQNSALVCVTEVKTKEKIDQFVAAWEGLK